MSKNEYVALRVIEDICHVLNVSSISDVVEYVSDFANIYPESELDMLENAIKVIADKKDKNEPISRNEYSFLYDLLIKAMDVRFDFNPIEYERFYEAYIYCIKVLPYDISNQMLKMFINTINTTPR